MRTFKGGLQVCVIARARKRLGSLLLQLLPLPLLVAHLQHTGGLCHGQSRGMLRMFCLCGNVSQ